MPENGILLQVGRWGETKRRTGIGNQQRGKCAFIVNFYFVVSGTGNGIPG